MAKIAVVFPGQGSQKLGMGREFVEASPQAAQILDQAEKLSGLALKSLCFDGPMGELTQTVNLQPAMVAVDLICWQALSAAGVEPLATAGHSLGEYPALCAAGALSVEDTLRLSALRGRLMDTEAAANPGAMAAVMGKSPTEVAGFCSQAKGLVQPANYNAPKQTVITGSKEGVASASAMAKEAGAKVIPLKVSGAWHSPLMEKAGVEMAEAIEEAAFGTLKCLHAPNTTGQLTGDARTAQAELMGQITSSVRWVQTIEALVERGVDTFIEAGPKNVLTGLIKKTAPEAKALNFDSPDGLKAVLGQIG